jgi:hypothetical protein
MTVADRTSKLLDKLQQVEAIGEGARQAMRKENVDLAAHEEELLEEVQRSALLGFPVLILLTRLRFRYRADASAADRHFIQGAAALVSSLAPQCDAIEQANQLLRAEKRFKEFEASVAQTNDQYQRQVAMAHFLCLACPHAAAVVLPARAPVDGGETA